MYRSKQQVEWERHDIILMLSLTEVVKQLSKCIVEATIDIVFMRKDLFFRVSAPLLRKDNCRYVHILSI